MEKQLTAIEHLTELRKRLIIVSIVSILSLILGFVLSPLVLEFIQKQPSASNISWNVFGFTDGILIYIKCAIVIAVLFTLPVALYQTWAFVRPGLTMEEEKGTIYYVPISFLLFLSGVLFSYFIVFPIVLAFMSSINTSIGAVETYGIAQYFTFMFNIILPISLVFEMPVVVLFLTKLGILDPSKLRKGRKVAYFLLVVLGVSITPPDIMSDIIIIIPLLLLYELSIFCSNWSIKRKKKMEA